MGGEGNRLEAVFWGGGFTQLPLHKGIPKVFFVASAFFSLFPYQKLPSPKEHTKGNSTF